MIILLLSKLYPKLFCQWGNNWPNSHQRDESVQQLVEKGQYYYTLSDQSVPQKTQILFFFCFFGESTARRSAYKYYLTFLGEGFGIHVSNKNFIPIQKSRRLQQICFWYSWKLWCFKKDCNPLCTLIKYFLYMQSKPFPLKFDWLGDLISFKKK